MSKYVIQNCPANYPVLGKEECLCGDTECQDCTDCVMKKIVELCEDVKKEYSKHKLDAIIAGKFNIAGKILLLLDIQECD